VARVLTALDRGQGVAPPLAALNIGAQPQAVADSPAGREVLLGTADEVRSAIGQALPGDVLTLLPGSYRFGQTLALAQPGRPDVKIVLRARAPDSVVIEFDTVQGFLVTGPDWRVENLTIRGTCASQPDCEHAFHVVGGARRFAALNNTISDFNAHFKITASRATFP
jgi:hypothetical protein